MSTNRIYKMRFSSVYPLYINKAEKKGRSKEEVDRIILCSRATAPSSWKSS